MSIPKQSDRNVTHDLYDIALTTIDGALQRMDQYRGQTILVVNVASQCGFTPQYAGLERLYRKYRDRGFVVLGFPCDQFGHQEPGTATEIKTFCSEQYDVTFPIFAKTDVNGDRAHPLFKLLKSARKGWLGIPAISWNFTKFLIDREGNVVARFGSRDAPERIEPRIVEVIEKLRTQNLELRT
jgi:glutathione peroxidase